MKQNQIHIPDLPEDVVLSVRNVSKKFCRNLRRSMWYGVQDLSKNLVGYRSNPETLDSRPWTIDQGDSRAIEDPKSLKSNGYGLRSNSDGLRPAEFWALQDISFDLRRGECLGLIGRNGCGKTTLLRLIAGIFPPDGGEIAIRGRVGALIALGAGFHPHMTGRENVYLNGAILGMHRSEIDAKFDEIMDFAEIGAFIDAPVSTYSSGMRVRLGFAVAVHTEPDLLLVDEVLAVGDGGFKIKSYNKIADVMSRAAVIFVSHSMPTVSRVSSRILLMSNGQPVYEGSDVAVGVERYMDLFEGEKAVVENESGAKLSKLSVRSVQRDEISNGLPVIHYLDDIIIAMDLCVVEVVLQYFVMLQITDKDMKIVAQYFSHGLQRERLSENTGKPMRVSIKIPECMFTNGEYAITIFIVDPGVRDGAHRHLAVYRSFTGFKVRGLDGALYAPVMLKGSVKMEDATV